MDAPIDPAALIAQQAAPRTPEAPPPDPEYPDDSTIEFPVPKNFTPPDEAKPGEPFQALGTFKMKDDGTMCLLAVDGSAVTP